MEPVQTGNGKITREIGAVPRDEHVCIFDVGFLDSGDFLRRRDVEEVGTIVCRISRIGIHHIESDLIFFNIRIVERFFIVKMAGDFLAGGKAFLE